MSASKTEPQPFTAYQIFLVAILALLQFSVVLDFMIISPIGDYLIKALDMTPARFGTVVSAYAFSAGAAGILAAGYADRFDRKKLLLFFYAGFILGTLFCALAVDFWTLLAARIVTGLFGGVISSVSLAIVGDLFSLEQRGRVMGFVQMSFSASQILGIPAGLYLAHSWGWEFTFFMIVVVSLFVFAAIVLRMQPITRHLGLQTGDNAFVHLWHTVSNADHLVGFAATTFIAVGGFMIMPFSSTFLINNVRISTEELPLVFLVTGISTVFVLPLVGKLCDVIDKFTVFAVGSLLSCVMVIWYTQLEVVPLWELMAINIILFVGIMGRSVPSSALDSAVPNLKDRGAYMSIGASLRQVAGGIGAVIAGQIVVQKTQTSPIENYHILGYIVVGTTLLCLGLVYRVDRLIKARGWVVQ